MPKKEGMHAHNSTYCNFMHKAYHIHKAGNILRSSNHQTNKWKWFQKTVVNKHKSIKTENTTIKIPRWYVVAMRKADTKLAIHESRLKGPKLEPHNQIGNPISIYTLLLWLQNQCKTTRYARVWPKELRKEIWLGLKGKPPRCYIRIKEIVYDLVEG